ncbi:MAG: hypothetical protein NTY15_17940 [Planctomycetota bacterium]|nr:hypothetical protein [Planctomycetota bacterium]
MKFQFEFPSSVVRFAKMCSVFALGLTLSGIVLPTLCADDTNRATSGRSGTASPLELEPKHGPWLVFAMSFVGKDSRAQAEQFAAELRRDYRLQAYCTSKKLDFTQPTTGAGFDKNGNTRKMKYLDKKVVDGCVVLVGDFDSIDGQAITETLATVKAILKKKYEANNTTGIQLNAFTTRNPLLPEEFYKTTEVDRFVKKLNEEKQHAEFNLLGCPGKFTVRVAVFSGEDRSIGGWGGSGNHSNIDEQKVSQLEIAAEKAALTTKALRKAGYEAYQFHDRSQSIVTVGSFNTLGKEDQRKNFSYDPLIQDIMKRFGGTSNLTRTREFGNTQTPHILIDMIDAKKFPELSQGDEKSRNNWAAKYSIPFDIKPTPMVVPKSAAASIYSGSLLGSDRR